MLLLPRIVHQPEFHLTYRNILIDELLQTQRSEIEEHLLLPSLKVDSRKLAGFSAGANAAFERLCATVVVAALTVPAFV